MRYTAIIQKYVPLTDFKQGWISIPGIPLVTPKINLGDDEFSALETLLEAIAEKEYPLEFRNTPTPKISNPVQLKIHSFDLHCYRKYFGGLENLQILLSSGHMPGTCGTLEIGATEEIVYLHPINERTLSEMKTD